MLATVAILTCPNCGEQSDVGVHTSMGATDLIPEECEVCGEPWPYDILYARETVIDP